VQSKASRNQLNLLHGTETKLEMLKKRWAARVRCVYIRPSYYWCLSAGKPPAFGSYLESLCFVCAQWLLWTWSICRE